MTVSDLDLFTPDPGTASSGALSTVATAYTVDPGARLVQVAVQGESLTLPAQPGRYRSGGLARVLLHPTTRRPQLVLGPVDPVAPSQLATVTAIGTGTVTVTWVGVATTLPAIPSTYTVGQTAWVDLDDWGSPFLVRGPSTLAAPGGGTPVTPPPSGGTVTATASVGPQWSGTWRTGSGWDRWNTGRFGGRSDVYQGSGYGSGLLRGIAVYGDQVVNLAATAVTGIKVTARRNEWADDGAASLVLQGSPHGTQPGGSPAASGTTVTLSPVGKGGWVAAWLPADVCEGMRTGAIKGLVAVGGGASGWGGTSTAGSLALEVTYTRPA